MFHNLAVYAGKGGYAPCTPVTAKTPREYHVARWRLRLLLLFVVVVASAVPVVSLAVPGRVCGGCGCLLDF